MKYHVSNTIWCPENVGQGFCWSTLYADNEAASSILRSQLSAGHVYSAEKIVIQEGYTSLWFLTLF